VALKKMLVAPRKQISKEIVMDKAMIYTERLTKSYGETKAVDALTLSIAGGEVFGFLGHNGAGKTTTLSILTTLIAPTSGEGQVAGFDLEKDALQIKRSIGYLPENAQLYDAMTGYENLLYFAKLSDVSKPKEAIERTVHFLEIDSYIHKKIGMMSKGMRQRVGIAQAILHEPKVLFLDEPSSGLDPMGMQQLRTIIIRLNTEMGMTIFMNTHLLSEVTAVCTSIGVLHSGKLIYVASVEATLKKFENEKSLEQIYFALEHNHEAAYA
jgi:ABC-2 type transport system ATP-binding protein